MLLSKFFTKPSVCSQAIAFQLRKAFSGNKIILRHGSSRRLMRSRYLFKGTTFRKLLVRYVIIGMVPCVLIATYCNLFIGDAVLHDHDPEVFQPEHWEYFKHPLSRFLAKYVMEDPKLSYYKDIYQIETTYRSHNQNKLILAVESLQKLEDEGMLAWQKNAALSRVLREPLEGYYEKELKDGPPAES